MEFTGDTDIKCPTCNKEFVDYTNDIDKGDGARTKLKCSCGQKFTLEASTVFTATLLGDDAEVETDLGKLENSELYARRSA